MKEHLYTSQSVEETEALAKTIAEELLSQKKTKAFVALFGDLGVGKTAFARGFGSALSCKNIKSPTYTIVLEHRGSPLPFFHFDFYRIESSEDLESIGFDDYLKRDGYILGEWCEKIEEELPPNAIRIYISKQSDEQTRTIRIIQP